ncbi:MAG: ATP-binding protein, partial [Acidimicrobiia bacterium]
ERFRSLIGTQADAVLVVDDEGVFRFANPSAGALFGDDPDALTGREFGAPILADSDEPTIELRDRTGGTVTASMRSAPIEWDGGAAWIVSLRDISRQLLLEEQVRLAQRLESVGRLTGGIAHDFNNLLSVILTASEEILLHTDDDGVELAGMIASAARRGSELTRSLLAFARRQPLTPVVADVGGLVTSMAPMLQRTLGDAIDVTVDVLGEPTADGSDGGGRLHAQVDRAGFESAILNLCVNGRDAMESGGRLRLTVDAHRHERGTESVPSGRLRDLRDGDYVRVTVTDEGTGIAPADLAHVFEPFFTTKEPGVGTGLGLPMVYGFALQSGGMATIDSEVGVGTEVSVYLPRVDDGVPAPREPGRAEPPTEANEATEAMRILLVEDGDLLRDLVGRQLRQLGNEVTAVATVEEALAALDAAHHDLLLSDIRLGGATDGHDLATMALARRDDLAVLLMSGLPPSSQPDEHGEVEILRKPFGQRELAAAVSRAVETQRQGRSVR